MHGSSPPRSFAVFAAQDDGRGRGFLLAVALVAGLLYAAVTPPDRVPDEYGHFLRAVAMAEGNVFPPVGFVLPGHHFPAGIWMFRNLLGKGDPAAQFTLDEETIGRLGLMDVKLPLALIVAERVLLLWVGMTCGVRWSAPARASAIAACAVTVAGISLAQYLVWSIICGNTIEGIQGRYFLPLLPLLLFSLAVRPRESGTSLIPIAAAGIVANGIAIAVLVGFYWT